VHPLLRALCVVAASTSSKCAKGTHPRSRMFHNVPPARRAKQTHLPFWQSPHAHSCGVGLFRPDAPTTSRKTA
jgi:hypothetical protein